MGLFIKGQVLARFVRHRLLTLTVPPSKENLAALRELIEAGKGHPGRRPDLAAEGGTRGHPVP
jgi:hypothetical protein